MASSCAESQIMMHAPSRFDTSTFSMYSPGMAGVWAQAPGGVPCATGQIIWQVCGVLGACHLGLSAAPSSSNEGPLSLLQGVVRVWARAGSSQAPGGGHVQRGRPYGPVS